jgi:hypothetical protein
MEIEFWHQLLYLFTCIIWTFKLYLSWNMTVLKRYGNNYLVCFTVVQMTISVVNWSDSCDLIISLDWKQATSCKLRWHCASGNVKIKMHKAIILSVFVWVWNLISHPDGRALECLWTGGWGKFCNYKIHISCPSSKFYWMIKSRRMRWS